MLFAALEKGARKCIGIDIDPDRVNAAREAAKSKGLDDKVTFIEADVMDVSLANASVVLCYLITEASEALKPKFESELKPGTRVVMESFPVPGWKPDMTKETGDRSFYLYTMPAEIDEKYQASQSSVVLTFVRWLRRFLR